MSFQFPADPTDGDIIVRGDLLATYREANDTWVIGQVNPVAGIAGPVGPKGETGDKGDAGIGLDIDGSVPTYADLPPANEINYNELWVVEETGHGWIWTERGWIDLGVIIQGPQGLQGEQGVEGPQGPRGDKARANRTDVIIETAPIPTGEVRSFEPYYFNLGTPKRQRFDAPTGANNYMQGSLELPMPSLASGAMIYMFMSSQLYPRFDVPFNPSDVRVYRSYIQHRLYCDGGVYSSEADYMYTTTTHNLSLNHNVERPQAIEGRYSNMPRTKIDEILFQPGTTLTFNLVVDVQVAGWCDVNVSPIRVIVVPFIDKESQVLPIEPDNPTDPLPGDELP